MTNVMRREVLWARPVLQASPSLRPSERSDQAKGKTHFGQGRGYSSVEPVLLGVQCYARIGRHQNGHIFSNIKAGFIFKASLTAAAAVTTLHFVG